MTHPEDHLAGYVDGTLSDPERAVVDAHLAGCATCREEIALARSALTALRSLDEVPVPFGVTGPILAEAGKQHERRGAVWQRVQWAAGLAAAAALVVVVAINHGGPSDRDAVERAAVAGGTSGGSESAPAESVRLEEQPDVNYDGDAGVLVLADEAIADFARSVTPSPNAAEASGADAPAGASGASEDSALQSVAPKGLVSPAPALRCLRTAGVPIGDPAMVLVRLVEARYNGDPAYLAVFLQSAGADQPPDRAVVWTLATADCSVLNVVDLPF